MHIAAVSTAPASHPSTDPWGQASLSAVSIYPGWKAHSELQCRHTPTVWAENSPSFCLPLTVIRLYARNLLLLLSPITTFRSKRKNFSGARSGALGAVGWGWRGGGKDGESGGRMRAQRDGRGDESGRAQ